jgi:hypothetical protein
LFWAVLGQSSQQGGSGSGGRRRAEGEKTLTDFVRFLGDSDRCSCLSYERLSTCHTNNKPSSLFSSSATVPVVTTARQQQETLWKAVEVQAGGGAIAQLLRDFPSRALIYLLA